MTNPKQIAFRVIPTTVQHEVRLGDAFCFHSRRNDRHGQNSQSKDDRHLVHIFLPLNPRGQNLPVLFTVVSKILLFFDRSLRWPGRPSSWASAVNPSETRAIE